MAACVCESGLFQVRRRSMAAVFAASFRERAVSAAELADPKFQ